MEEEEKEEEEAEEQQQQQQQEEEERVSGSDGVPSAALQGPLQCSGVSAARARVDDRHSTMTMTIHAMKE